MTKRAHTDLAELVTQLQRELTADLMARLRASGFDDVTPAFASILPFIDVAGGRQSDIARRAGLTKQAVGQLVRELEHRGYVVVAADPTNARARRVQFTERGLALRERGFALKRERARRLRVALGSSSLAEVETGLAAAIAALRGGGTTPSD